MKEINTSVDTFSLDRLYPNTKYAIQVRSYNEDSYSDWSPAQRFDTTVAATPLPHIIITNTSMLPGDLPRDTSLPDPEDFQISDNGDGTYTVSATFDWDIVNSPNACDYIVDVVQFGWNTLTQKNNQVSYGKWAFLSFQGTISSYDAISNLDTSNLTSMEQMFYNAYNFNTDISSWDTSNVTDMSNMFYSCYSFDQDLSGWDTSKVTTMRRTFNRARAFNNGGVAFPWNTSSVTRMDEMFREAWAFNQDISGWDTSNVTNMSYMFRNASIFNNGGAALTWDTSNVTSMYHMFYQAYGFNANIGSWNTSNVAQYSMDYMFYYASSFNQDLSGWCVSNHPSKPTGFDTGATSWTLSRPIWGTCP